MPRVTRIVILLLWMEMLMGWRMIPSGPSVRREEFSKQRTPGTPGTKGTHTGRIPALRVPVGTQISLDTGDVGFDGFVGNPKDPGRSPSHIIAAEAIALARATALLRMSLGGAAAVGPSLTPTYNPLEELLSPGIRKVLAPFPHEKTPDHPYRKPLEYVSKVANLSNCWLCAHTREAGGALAWEPLHGLDWVLNSSSSAFIGFQTFGLKVFQTPDGKNTSWDPHNSFRVKGRDGIMFDLHPIVAKHQRQYPWCVMGRGAGPEVGYLPSENCKFVIFLDPGEVGWQTLGSMTGSVSYLRTGEYALQIGTRGILWEESQEGLWTKSHESVWLTGLAYLQACNTSTHLKTLLLFRKMCNASYALVDGIYIDLPGVYWICGKTGYKYLPIHWRGLCSIGYLTVAGHLRDNVMAHEALNLGYPTVHTKPNIREKRSSYQKSSGLLDFLRALIPGWGVSDLQIYTRNLSRILQEGLEKTASSLFTLQKEVDSIANVVLQNRRVLDQMLSEQGGACAYLGEVCCFYVNKSGQILSGVKTLRGLVKQTQEADKAFNSGSDLFQWLTSWLPDFSWLRHGFVIILVFLMAALLIYGCIRCMPGILKSSKKLFAPPNKEPVYELMKTIRQHYVANQTNNEKANEDSISD